MAPEAMSANGHGVENATPHPAEQKTFEEALALAKFGLFNYALIIISGTIQTAVMLEIMGTSYVIAVAGCELQLTTTQKGILGAVVITGIIVSSHLWGFLADTQGRRKVIVPTLFLAFVLTIISSFSPNFAWIATSRFLTGFFISGSSASVFPYLGEFHTYDRRSNAIMGASFVFGIGCMLLPGIAFITINNDWVLRIPLVNFDFRPWRLFLIVCGLPGFLSALALLKFPESPRFLFNKGRKEQAVKAITWMHQFNTRGKENALQIELIDVVSEPQKQKDQHNPKGVCSSLKRIWNQTAPLFMAPYLRRTFLVCILQFGTYFTAHGMFMFFPGVLNEIVSAQQHGTSGITTCEAVYARQPANQTMALDANEMECYSQTLNLATYGYTFATDVVFMLVAGLVMLIIGTIGRLPVLVFVFACCGISGILMVFLDIPWASIWIYIAFVQAGLNGSVVNAVAVDLFPTNFRAMAVSISLMFGRLGSIFGTNINGLLLDTHCELTFWIASGMLLLCGVLSFFIPGIRKQAGLRESITVR